MPEGFRQAVVDALGRVGPGQVVSYGDLAAEAGYPGAARGVGAVLAGSAGAGLTWWRVVYGDGRLAPGHEVEQARRLAAEGVAVADGRVRRPATVDVDGRCRRSIAVGAPPSAPTATHPGGRPGDQQ